VVDHRLRVPFFNSLTALRRSASLSNPYTEENFDPIHLRHEKREVDAGSRNGIRRLEADTGFVGTLDQERRNSCRRETCRLGGGGRLLARDGEQLHCASGLVAGIPIRHHYLQIGVGVGERSEHLGQPSGLVVDLAETSVTRTPRSLRCARTPPLKISSSG